MKRRRLLEILLSTMIVVILMFSIKSGKQPIPYVDNMYLLNSDSDVNLSGGSSVISDKAAKETAYYGAADNITVRDLEGRADYIVCSHALYNGGNDILDNVRYLHDHGVKVILDMHWWDVWPISGAVNGWPDMHKTDIVYGMNATESVKYRIRGCLDNIGPEYVYGITLGEEEGPPGEFPGEFVAWYLNLFYDWMKEEYPAIKVFQFPAPYTWVLDPSINLKADGIVVDDYSQELDIIDTEARLLKEKFPNADLLFFVSAVENFGWFTAHTPTYLKQAVDTVLSYAEIVGFWVTDGDGNEGWEVKHWMYNVSLQICDQLHAYSSNTVYADTSWFPDQFGNDSITDSLDHWYGSNWREVAPDSDLTISASSDRIMGEVSVNLTRANTGAKSFWWQPVTHDYGLPDYPTAGPYGVFNISAASRIRYFVKGVGWEDKTDPQAYISIEKYNSYFADGNLTLPDMSSLLTDGEWHEVIVDLPLSPEYYYEWDGYASQIRIVSSYSSGTTPCSILFDGWEIQALDAGKILNLTSVEDYTKVENGTLFVEGNAVVERVIDGCEGWYYSYSGTGQVTFLINGTWEAAPEQGTPVYEYLGGFRLSGGSFDYIKIDALPPLVSIESPSSGSTVSGEILIEVSASDVSGIANVTFTIDGVDEYVDSSAPYEWLWDSSSKADGLHLINVTAASQNNTINYDYCYVTVDNTPPTVTIDQPTNGSAVMDSVLIAASSSDTSGVPSVEFYIENVLVFTDYSSPYEYLWNTTVGDDGMKNITCYSTDSAGNKGSDSILTMVDNSGPELSIYGLLIWGDSGLMAVNTSDASGIDRVEFYLGGSLQYTDYSYPYEWIWSGLSLPDGTYAVSVLSYDTLNHSSSVVSGFELDNTKPSLSVSWTPSENLLSGLVMFDAVASDTNGVAYVQFHLDGTLQYTDYSAPYEWSWYTTLVQDGDHSLTVTATDNRGNSNQITVNLNVDNTAPSIFVNNPANETTLSGPCAITVNVTAHDTTGIDTVLLSYYNGSSWNMLTMIPSGSWFQAITAVFPHNTIVTFYVFANDTLGNEISSELYQCIVIDDSGPIVGLPTIIPEVPTPFNIVTVSTSVTDGSGVDTVLLSYRVDLGEWTNTTMTLNSVYWANIPAMPTGSIISYRLYANDTLGQWSSSPVYEYTVIPFDVLPPEIADSSWTPSTPDETQPVTVTVNATDPSGVTIMITAYHDGPSWHNITMTLLSGQYAAVIPSQNYGTMVTLKIYASDGQGNWGVTPLGSYTVVSSDLDGPDIVLLSWTPSDPTEENSVEVYVELSDANEIHSAILCYSQGSAFVNVSMRFNETGYVATIGPQPVGAQVDLCVYSCDSRNNWAVGDWQTYTVGLSDSSPPVISGVDSTPTSPFANDSIEIVASIEDENDIALVILEYHDGLIWRNLTMQSNPALPNQYSVAIPPISSAGTIQARILALDAKGNWGSASMMNIEVQSIPVPPPPTEPTIPMSDMLFMGAISVLGVGLPIGLIIGLAAPRLLKRRSK